ncbi:MAG: hypothetical protein ABIQ93_03455 [Saprospiraceae bacterium]
MKRIQTILALTLTLLAFTAAQAQTEMHWDTHGVGFTVPANFKIDTNNAEEYTASNDNIFLSITPIQDENITKDHLADAVVEMAKALEYDIVEDADEADVDDFTGYYVKGRKDGVNAILMALLDQKSSTNLLVVVVYDDNSLDKAVDIANSFFAYDK